MPSGTKRQASFVAVQVPVFLPVGTVAILPARFWIPITPLPPFHPGQGVLVATYTSITFDVS